MVANESYTQAKPNLIEFGYYLCVCFFSSSQHFSGVRFLFMGAMPNFLVPDVSPTSLPVREHTSPQKVYGIPELSNFTSSRD